MQYAQEQEFFRQTALISKKEKEKVSLSLSLSLSLSRSDINNNNILYSL